MSPSPVPLHVAIVGGGPGGLTLAAILKELHITFTVFELDASRAARGQGGMLDIHKRSGQLALEKAGLLPIFKKHMRVDATELWIRDSQAKVHLHHSEEGEEDPERPEIDRTVLRGMLIDALDPETIGWGKKLVTIDLEEGGKYRLNFADGTSEGGFDIVVGADGTWSKVRALRSETTAPYSGITGVVTSIADADTRYPSLSAFVGNGSAFNCDGTRSIMAQKNGDGSIKAYAFFSAPEGWKKTVDIDWTKSGEAAIHFMAQYYGGWVEEITQLITSGDEGELAVRPLYQHPPGQVWNKINAGATLLGDAAHVMTPFTGVGVNLAMHDAYDLSLAIAEVAAGTSSIGDALGGYEDKMLERATLHVNRTIANQKLFFEATNGAEEVAAKLKEYFGPN